MLTTEQLLDSVIDGNHVNVAFSDSNSLDQLRKMLEQLIEGNTEINKSVTSQTKDTKAVIDTLKSTFEKSLSTSNDHLEKMSTDVKNLNKALDDQNKNASGFNGEQFANTMTTIFTKSAGVAKNILEKNIQRYNIFRDLHGAGVTVVSGFDSVSEHASTAGMKLDDFAKILTSSSPVVAKLNGTFNDGTKTFSETMAAINNDLLLSFDEQSAVMNSYVETSASFKLTNKMSEAQLKKEVNEYAIHLKSLSVATGKSVQAIIEETDLRNKGAKQQMLFARNKKTYDTLSNLGFSDNAIEEMMTGKEGPELLGMRSSSRMMNALINDAQATMKAGGEWDETKSKDFKEQAEKNGLADSHRASMRALQNDNAMYLAQDDEYSAGVYANYIVGDNFLKRNTKTMKKSDQESIEKVQTAVEAKNEAYNRTIDTVTMNLDTMGDTADTVAKALNTYNDALQNGIGSLSGGAVQSVVGVSQILGPLVGGALAQWGVSKLGGGVAAIGGKVKSAWSARRGRKGDTDVDVDSKTTKGGTPNASSKTVKGTTIAKEATENAGKKGALKTVGKLGKAGALTVAKKIPLLSILTGAGAGAMRAFNGDWAGAGLELASGVAGSFPGLGTAASFAIDAALAAKDGAIPGIGGDNSNSPQSSGGVQPPKQKSTFSKIMSASLMLGAGGIAHYVVDAIKNSTGSEIEDEKQNSSTNSNNINPENNPVSLLKAINEKLEDIKTQNARLYEYQRNGLNLKEITQKNNTKEI